jgi:hypothetical protein
MESRVTTKKIIEKAHFISSTIPEELFPLDVYQLTTEIGAEELYEWGKSKIEELQDLVYKITSGILNKNLQYFVRTIEIDSALQNDRQLLTLKFIFIGKFKISDLEQIGIKFRNQVEKNFKIVSYQKIIKVDNVWDLVITIIPLQFYELSNLNKISDELLELVINRSMMVLPRYFFTNKHLNNPENLLDYSI